ncbi:MAG: GNAT family N-acetyltransferase [Sphingomonadaceae bacterium]|nr:GNAT family N-acetyltransferase [Sphingomonadaceae bacterium]
MSAPPKTRLVVDAAEVAAIRRAVIHADVSLLGGQYAIANDTHVDALVTLLVDPRVSDPIYDLPRPITPPNIRHWVTQARAAQTRGEAILCVMLDMAGAATGYSYFTIWPDFSAAEIGGAHRPDGQSRGLGGAGALRSFDWMFEHLGVRLICLTAAKDNIRSARLITHAGFTPMGERTSTRPDGSTRESLYWEMQRDDWRALHAKALR